VADARKDSVVEQRGAYVQADSSLDGVKLRDLRSLVKMADELGLRNDTAVLLESVKEHYLLRDTHVVGVVRLQERKYVE
jgi:hypothetical protein